MRSYAIGNGFIQHEEIVRDLKNKDKIKEMYGEEHFKKMYIAMCNCTREISDSENYVSISIPTEEHVNKYELDDNYYLMIEFDHKVDTENHKIFNVKWDNEKKMPYIEVE